MSGRERPILFSGPMVRAILDGLKTQTRRVCKPADGLSYVVAVQDPNERGQRPPYFTPGWFGDEDGEIQFSCPYGQPGDRLWVRETWRTAKSLDEKSPTVIGKMCIDAGYLKSWAPVAYEADGHRNSNWQGFEMGGAEPGKARVSIHMPRWASRITLEITDVRVERLQDISASDAKAEGVEQFDPSATAWLPACSAHRYAYEDLWKSINGPDSWNLNPWVWCIYFRRVES